MVESNWGSHWDEESKRSFWNEPALEVIEFVDSLDISAIRDVLDLGCGIGRHALLFAERGFNVTALDSSEEALGVLREKIAGKDSRISIIRGNYSDDIFPGKSFDLILAYNVIYHGYRESFVNAVRLVHGWLRPGGRFFFTCPTRRDAKYGDGEEVAANTYRSMNSVHPGDIHYFADEDDITGFLSRFACFSERVYEHYWDNRGVRQFSSYRAVTARK